MKVHTWITFILCKALDDHHLRIGKIKETKTKKLGHVSALQEEVIWTSLQFETWFGTQISF
jgi:hypothetical protein